MLKIVFASSFFADADPVGAGRQTEKVHPTFYYDPFVTFVILALAAGSIVVLWRPPTLAQFRPRRHAASRHHPTKETPHV
jgi:hypothetical protein